MSSAKYADVPEYGISTISRQLLVFSFSLFVLGGLIATEGVISRTHVNIYFGLGVCILGIALYTNVVIFTEIRLPPTAISHSGFETISRIKPATFQQALPSQLMFLISSALFATGCILVVMGFNRGSTSLWIPGYFVSIVGCLLNLITIAYGPLNIKPGAAIVSLPDDCVQNYRVADLDAQAMQALRKDSLMDFAGCSTEAQRATSPRVVYEYETPGPSGYIYQYQPGDETAWRYQAPWASGSATSGSYSSEHPQDVWLSRYQSNVGSVHPAK